MIAKCLNPKYYELYKAEKIGVTPCPDCGSTDAVNGDIRTMLQRGKKGGSRRGRS